MGYHPVDGGDRVTLRRMGKGGQNALIVAMASSTIKQFYLPDDPDPARSLHCNDATADTSDSKAAEWWSANSYKYITGGWSVGLCPAKYNITNNEYHPVDGGDRVTLRRMGKGGQNALMTPKGSGV